MLNGLDSEELDSILAKYRYALRNKQNTKELE